ncbi:NACHT domain-containing protein [Streptomyces sp. NPDC002643]
MGDGDLLTGWPIGVGGFLLGILVLALKDWIVDRLKLVLDFVYARLADSALFRRTALAKYTRALYERHRRFAVSFQIDDDLKLPMESVYVPLRGARTDGTPGELAADLRAERHSVVLGVPGSGKTMLLRHQVLMWARQRIRDPHHPDAIGSPDGQATPGRRAPRPRVDLGELRDIPVLLELHRLNKAPELTLEQHIVQHFARHDFPGADKWVARALDRGDLALYFDGLDEVSSDLRPRAVELLKEFVERYPSCRTVVTCRVAVYEGWFAEPFGQTLRVRDFDEHLIRRFLNGWPWRTATAAERTRTVDQVLGALRDTPQIMSLARNPLLLTMIAYLYDFVYAHTDQVLPHTRAEFYRQVIDSLLIDRRRQSAFPFPLKKAILQELALVAQDIPSGTHDRLALPHARVLETVRAVLERQQRDPATADEVLNEIVHRSGLLLAVDNGERYQFAHLTLQEYLAAVALAANPTGLLRRYHDDPAAWRETVRLWCGVEPRDCTQVVREVFARDEVLAFQCLADAHTVEDGPAEEILDHFRRMLGHASQSFGSVSVTDEAVIAAFGLVAGDRRRRGAEVFDFLAETVRADADPDRVRAAAHALAETNLPRAAETLAAIAEPAGPAWYALVDMGDLAVDAFRERAVGHPSAVTALWTIRTPKAALALAGLLWQHTRMDVRVTTAFCLGELLTVPEIAEELRGGPVPSYAPESLDWVWRPFARGADDALVRIAGRIAAIVDATDGDAWTGLPTPDPRIVAALAAVRQNGVRPSDDLLPEVPAGDELAEWLRRRHIDRGHLTSPVSDSGEVETTTLARYLEDEFDAGGPFALHQARAALTAAGLAPGRLAKLLRLPDPLQLRVAVALLKQHRFAEVQSWDVLPPESEERGYDYNRSPHYRLILLLGLVVSGFAAWGAWGAATGDMPWGPQWLSVAVLVQIPIGWVLLVAFGDILTDSTSFVAVGLLGLPALVLALATRQWVALMTLGTVGLFPAVSVYSYVVVRHHWGGPAAVTAAVLVVGVCVAAAVRGSLLTRREEARTHPVRELVLKALLTP